MGCYDTVRLSCPSCGAVVEVQSKAGKCQLKYYAGAAGVPPEIAMDIAGDVVECDKCKKPLQVIAMDPITTVRMTAVPVG